ncbi:MAG: hypothetical protein AUG44_24415 [Actinobacteria bacterium 13_1_20CM_3_71_11]|nr:MAG: hypothetical protein AUG44_24415 [Actinobacteria bacterium 13_1_20CM_3_71_11]
MAMGSLRGDNGGGRAPDGGGLPDLPPEWGTIIIPDDAGELSREAAAIRRELRRFTRRNRWRARLHLPLLTEAASRDTPTLGLPVLIMAVALVATLTSLFALAWPSRTVRPLASPVQHASVAPGKVPDLTLVDVGGGPVHLRNVLPAVLLLLQDGCACADLELATAMQVPAGVTVLAVGRTAPILPTAVPTGLHLRAVADPRGALRSAYGAPGVTGVIAVLVRGTGDVVRTVHPVGKVDDFRDSLSQLA